MGPARVSFGQLRGWPGMSLSLHSIKCGSAGADFGIGAQTFDFQRGEDERSVAHDN